MQNIYLDNAATTALDKRVLAEMLPYLTEEYGNPSAIHGPGRRTRLAIEESRKTVATLLDAKPAEIFFTSCGTESTNTVLQGIVKGLKCKHIITSPIEHHATLRSAEILCQEYDLKLHYCKHDHDGVIDYDHLHDLISSCAAKGKTFVSIMHANNELGIINDIVRIGTCCKEATAYFHTDMVQTIGHIPISLNDLAVDFVSGSSHKFHGPKGKGLLYVNSNVQIQPMILGGGQERNMRAGTEDVAGVVGFAKALSLAIEDMEVENRETKLLKDYCLGKLKSHFLELKEASQAENKLPRVLTVLFKPTPKTEMLQMSLDMKGVAVSGGSACSSGAMGGSHVINHLNKEACVPLRISFCKWNTKEEVDYLIESIVSILD